MIKRPMRWITIVVALVLGGCAHSPQTRIYTIDPVPAPVAPLARRAGTALRVTSFRIQRDLDRIEVVWQEQPNRLEIDDFAHWGAPLGQLARAAFIQDLTARLGKDAVVSGGIPADRATADLSLEMLSLRRVGGQFEADVAWSMAATSTSRPAAHISHFSTPVSQPGAEGEAAAMTAIVGLLADEVVKSSAAGAAK